MVCPIATDLSAPADGTGGSLTMMVRESLALLFVTAESSVTVRPTV
jgi:hypothetical protein